MTNLTALYPMSPSIDSDALLFTALSATQHEQMVNDEGDTILASDALRAVSLGPGAGMAEQFRITKDETFHLFSTSPCGDGRSIRTTRRAQGCESRSATAI